MAFPTIIAINQTELEVPLTRLGLIVPASGLLTLSTFADPHEIWRDPTLYAAVSDGSVLLSLGASTLNQGESLRMFGLSTAPIMGVVRVVADANVTLSGTPMIDGVVLVVGDRVLLTDQLEPIENGPWVVQSGAWVRPDDFDVGQSSTVVVPISGEGVSYRNQIWNVSGNAVGSAVTATQNVAPDNPVRTIHAIKALFKATLASAYSEFTYEQRNLTQVDVWETPAKLTKLFTRVLTYTQQNLTQVVTTDEITETTLTQTFTYTISNDLFSREEMLS